MASDVEKQMKTLAVDEKKAAIKAAKVAAQEHGFDIEELFGPGGAGIGKSKSGKSINPPKYRNPENPGQTWSGRGRRPGWIAEAEAAGKSLSDLAI